MLQDEYYLKDFYIVFNDNDFQIMCSNKKYHNDDIVYKTLVDNYIQASIEYDKKQLKAKKNEKVDSSKVSEAINALAKYKDELHRKYVLNCVKEINITDEDIRDMICDGILNGKILKDILKFKGLIKSEVE